MKRALVLSVLIVLFSAASVMATPCGVDFRVRGGTANWDAAIFTDNPLDQYGLSPDSGSIWGDPVDYTLTYSGGIATFALAGHDTLTYDFGNQGFTKISLYARATRYEDGKTSPDDEASITALFDGGNYQASTAGPWAQTLIYDGSSLTDISMSGTISFINEAYFGSGDERLKAGVLFEYPCNQVPIPGAVWLLGSGLVALVGFRRRKRG